MKRRERLLVWAAFVGATACQRGAAVRGEVAPSLRAATMTTLTSPADTEFVRIRSRLESLHYRIDVADAAARRLVVRPPGDETKVELRISTHGDSSGVDITPINATDLVASMRALVTVTHDATIDPVAIAQPGAPDNGELPPSHWRPAFFVAPNGTLWMVRSGVFSTDSLMGRWRRVFGRAGDPIDADKLRIGTTMAFVGNDTLLLGLRNPTVEDRGPLAFRSTDGGQSWAPIPTADLTSIDAMEAARSSVWIFGTWFPNGRRTMLLRSSDGGATWDRPQLPNAMNDVTGSHRVTPMLGYAATAGYNKGPVLWRTSDGGNTWTPLPTPHDQGINPIPSYGSRVEEIATVGRWLVVREYGSVFATHPDSIRWLPLAGVDHVATDRVRDQLFTLTTSLQAAILNSDLSAIWKTDERIPLQEPSDVEVVEARDGVGYIVTSHGGLYEARNGRLRGRRSR